MAPCILQAITGPGWGLSAGVHQGMSALGWGGMGWEKAVTCSVLRAERTAVRCEVVPIPRCPGTVQPLVLTHGADGPVPRSLGQGEVVPAPAQLTWRRGSGSHPDARTHVPIASTSGHQ